MEERSLLAAVLVVESALRCMHKCTGKTCQASLPSSCADCQSHTPSKKIGIARLISSFTVPEIKRLFQQARTVYQTDSLRISAVHTQGPFSKILVVTPKKIGSAPMRNKLRRRLKALFYQEKLYQEPFTLLVFCKKGSPFLTFQDLKSMLEIIYTGLKNNPGKQWSSPSSMHS